MDMYSAHKNEIRDNNFAQTLPALQDVNKPIAAADYELIVPKKELQTLVLKEMNKTVKIV